MKSNELHLAALIKENQEKIDFLIDKVDSLNTGKSPPKKYLTKEETKKFLGIGNTKLWELEKMNLINPNNPFGSVKYYNREKLEDLMSKNIKNNQNED